MRTVIVADDSTNFNSLCRTFLTKDNTLINVVSTFTGQETIDKYKEIQPDVLILDYKLPDMTGADVIRELEKDENEQKKKNVILVTGENIVSSEIFSFKKISNSFNKTNGFERIEEEIRYIIEEERKKNRNINQEVKNFLFELGIKNYSSYDYRYLIAAIEIVCADDDLIDKLNHVYKVIGRKYHKKAHQVDNKIYYAVNAIKDIMTEEQLKNIFYVHTPEDKFSVRTFIEDSILYINSRSTSV